jgi:hypothetical protein
MPQGSFLAEPSGSEKDDGVLDVLAAKGFEGIQVFGKNSQRPSRIARQGPREVKLVDNRSGSIGNISAAVYTEVVLMQAC